MTIKDRRYKSYGLTVLLFTLTFNGADRSALGLLLQDIKVDLALTDAQLGLLTGLAFAVFYSIMGIPIARWADSGNRVKIISVTTMLASAMVSACGAAANFVQLLLIRICVAVGESGFVPSAHSLIADYFTRAERPRAIGIFMLGGPLSAVVGFMLAGWLNEIYGWRLTFTLLGLPGLGLAALVWLTVREPRLGKVRADIAGRDAISASGEGSGLSLAHPSLTKVCALLWTTNSFRHLLFCFIVQSFFSYGIAKWQPTFFIRSYGLETGELGTWFAAIFGIGGLLGTYWGGELASRRAAHNERLQLKWMAIMYAGLGVITPCIFLAPNHYLAFCLMGLATAGGCMITAPLFATIQAVVPQHIRATSIAIIYFFANLIGMGLGPVLVGALSDAFRSWAAEESLRYALLALCPGYFWGMWHVWRATRTVMCDLVVVDSDNENARRGLTSGCDDFSTEKP